MSCLSWNCRRLGNPQTEEELVALISKKDPKIVFLMETKVEKITIERICRKLKFVNFFVIPMVNQGGGLALLWRENINLIMFTSSDRHIDASIDFGMDDDWHFIGFYGDPEIANQEHSCSLLRDLSQRLSLPCVCMEDFNEIIWLEERQGWLDCPER